MSTPYPDIRVPPASVKPVPPSPTSQPDDGMRDSNNITQNTTTILSRDDLMMVFAVLGSLIGLLGLALWYNTSETMKLYEREIKLAQRDAQDAKNQTNTLKEVLEIVGLKVPKKEDSNEQQ